MNAPEKKEEVVEPIKLIRRDVVGMELQFKAALPAHVPPERFIRIAMTAISTSKDLQLVDRGELYSELMKCAQDGLLPDGREAVIVCYYIKAKGRKVPKYMPMVGGICKKARNSGVIKEMNAHVVYEKDEYDYWADETGEHFKFRKFRGAERGGPILTFAFATTTDGGFFFEEIDEEQMEAIEACSPADNSPWKGDFRNEMKRKSAIRRLAKYRLPSSTDLDEVIRRDDDMYDFQAPTLTAAESAKALAARQHATDYLPGIKPPMTAEQLVAKLKGVPQGNQLIVSYVQQFIDRKDEASAEKLRAAATAAGIAVEIKDLDILPPGSDEDIAAAARETEELDKEKK